MRQGIGAGRSVLRGALPVVALSRGARGAPAGRVPLAQSITLALNRPPAQAKNSTVPYQTYVWYLPDRIALLRRQSTSRLCRTAHAIMGLLSTLQRCQTIRRSQRSAKATSAVSGRSSKPSGSAQQPDLEPDPALASILIVHCGGCGAGTRLNAERDKHRHTAADVLNNGL
jgi:hypothetical protein